MQYKYIGDGVGVPGLPHEISEEEAQEQGLSELLMAAVANGNYQAVDQPAAKASRFQKSKTEDEIKEQADGQ